jgi:aldose 1-epimerase
VTPLSGTQVSISSHGYDADVASVGATLRGLRHDGREIVGSFEADELRPYYRGATLVPWPNRVVDGLYSFDGVDYVLPLTEPDRGHALHGLASWLDFAVADQATDSVRLLAHVPAQAGYPFPLTVEVLYSVGADGLRTRVITTNDGAARAPYGVGPHPYLVAGEGLIDDWTLELPAAQMLEVGGERLVPTELVPVAGRTDFRSPKLLGDTQLDNAFTDLQRGTDGRIRVRLRAADGHGVEMNWGEGLDWVQIFTSDLPTPEGRREAVAIEPMTCPPDAFNTTTDLIVLEPGASHTAEWFIAAI